MHGLGLQLQSTQPHLAALIRSRLPEICQRLEVGVPAVAAKTANCGSLMRQTSCRADRRKRAEGDRPYGSN
jgi:hypothetical protein